MSRALAWLRNAYVVAMYAFVLLPVFVIVAISINSASTFPAAFTGLTSHWYWAILDRPEFLTATQTSCVVALLASLIAVLIAFLAAYALVRHRPAGGSLLETVLMSPLLVPQIVVSLAILQFANAVGTSSGLFGLVAAHAVYVMPFALRLILTGMERFNFSLEEAAQSLGAGWFKTWRLVTFPILRPSIVAGFTFCFILSIVNLPLSLFLTNTDTATLPIVMFAYMESRIDPMIAAVASVTVIVAALATLLLEKFLKIRLVD